MGGVSLGPGIGLGTGGGGGGGGSTPVIPPALEKKIVLLQRDVYQLQQQEKSDQDKFQALSQYKLTADAVVKALDKGVLTASADMNGLPVGNYHISNAQDVVNAPANFVSHGFVSVTSAGTVKVQYMIGLNKKGRVDGWIREHDGSKWVNWTDLRSVDGEGDDWKAAVAQLKSGLGTLSTKVGSLERDVAQLKQQVASDNTREQTDVTALKARVAKLEGGQAPAKPSHTIHGGFGGDWGDFVSFSGSATDDELTLTKLGSTPEYAYIAVDPAAAADVQGIMISHGLPALWESRDATISGKQYKLFRSPYKFTQSSMTFEVKWG